jgi:hypothetical protein
MHEPCIMHDEINKRMAIGMKKLWAKVDRYENLKNKAHIRRSDRLDVGTALSTLQMNKCQVKGQQDALGYRIANPTTFLRRYQYNMGLEHHLPSLSLSRSRSLVSKGAALLNSWPSLATAQHV